MQQYFFTYQNHRLLISLSPGLLNWVSLYFSLIFWNGIVVPFIVQNFAGLGISPIFKKKHKMFTWQILFTLYVIFKHNIKHAYRLLTLFVSCTIIKKE